MILYTGNICHTFLRLIPRFLVLMNLPWPASGKIASVSLTKGYILSIEGQIQTFQEYNDKSLEDFKQELQHYFASSLASFRSERIDGGSGKIGSVTLIRE